MNRRAALLTVLSLPLGSFNAVTARAQGANKPVLSIPLDQWAAIEIKHHGAVITLTPKDIFEILKETK